MASGSAFFLALYKQKVEEIKEYEENIKDLTKIQRSLNGDLEDEIRGVNQGIEDLKAELVESIRHNSIFINHKDELDDEKEKSASQDSKLAEAEGNIGNELTRLEGKKNAAISARDSYWRQYQEAKRIEEEAARAAAEAARIARMAAAVSSKK